MNIDEVIESLSKRGYYVEFEVDSDHEYTCLIRDGYWEEVIDKTYSGEGKTLSESLKSAVDKMEQTP